MKITKEQNELWKFSADNEWYTCLIDVENFVNHNNFNFENLTVWFPFDNESSAFVKYWKNKGWNFVNSHIDEGKNFYEYEPEKYDLIISNPPFKGKSKIIKRLIEIDKPFALIFGIQCFNSGGFTSELSKVKDLGMTFAQRRMKFHKGIELEKSPSPTFHSMWISSRLIPEKISFILTEKKENKNV